MGRTRRPSQNLCTIVKLDKSPKTIVLLEDGGEESDQFEVDRHEVIAEWELHKHVPTISFTPGAYADPDTSDDLLVSVWQAATGPC